VDEELKTDDENAENDFGDQHQQTSAPARSMNTIGRTTAR